MISYEEFVRAAAIRADARRRKQLIEQARTAAQPRRSRRGHLWDRYWGLEEELRRSRHRTAVVSLADYTLARHT